MHFMKFYSFQNNVKSEAQSVHFSSLGRRCNGHKFFMDNDMKLEIFCRKFKVQNATQDCALNIHRRNQFRLHSYTNTIHNG
jgi:hypothetical protein